MQIYVSNKEKERYLHSMRIYICVCVCTFYYIFICYTYATYFVWMQERALTHPSTHRHTHMHSCSNICLCGPLLYGVYGPTSHYGVQWTTLEERECRTKQAVSTHRSSECGSSRSANGCRLSLIVCFIDRMFVVFLLRSFFVSVLHAPETNQLFRLWIWCLSLHWRLRPTPATMAG